jgi:two-component sensor histidine kinase
MPESESIPIALTINELLTNAIKHGSGDKIRCEAKLEDVEPGASDAQPGRFAQGQPGAAGARQVVITIGNRGRLPPGFELARFPGTISGLGLARALLPRRSATLALVQQGEDVVAQVCLRAPSVVRADAAAPALMTSQ